MSAYNNIGTIYAKDEEYLKALPYFCTAIQINPQFPGLQQNFNRALSLAQAEKEADPQAFWQVFQNEAFQRAAVEKVRFVNRDCRKDICSFSFISRFDQGDIILPNLIQGVIESGESIAISTPSFDPQTGMIKIDSDAQYEKQTVSFIFPTCGGVYYETSATINL